MLTDQEWMALGGTFQEMVNNLMPTDQKYIQLASVIDTEQGNAESALMNVVSNMRRQAKDNQFVVPPKLIRVGRYGVVVAYIVE